MGLGSKDMLSRRDSKVITTTIILRGSATHTKRAMQNANCKPNCRSKPVATRGDSGIYFWIYITSLTR